jgi:DNA-binding CsgD family transcriptional regulator
MMQAGPFSTQDLRRGLIGPLSPEETEVLDFAAALGLPHAFIAPLHGANGYRGLACLVGPGPDPSPRDRALLHFLMLHAHDRLRALSAQTATDAMTLTPREVHVLSLSRRGLSDSQIAHEAGITPRTVRFHFENARHKLGARNRAEALSLAIARHLLPH